MVYKTECEPNIIPENNAEPVAWMFESDIGQLVSTNRNWCEKTHILSGIGPIIPLYTSTFKNKETYRGTFVDDWKRTNLMAVNLQERGIHYKTKITKLRALNVELLAALQLVMGRPIGGELTSYQRQKARAAIAKATALQHD